MRALNHKTISRLPASRFPDPADVYFCDNCGRDLTKNLHRDRAPVWQPLRPMWYVCQCRRKYPSGAAEWDDLTTWERKQRIRQLSIGFALFALLVIPGTLAYFALKYGGATLLLVAGIALIPSVLAARPFGFVLLDLYEIIASVWRTRVVAKRASPATTANLLMRRSPRNLRFTPVAALIAVFIIATRWIPLHIGPAVAAYSSPERSNAGRKEVLSAPSKPSLSVAPQAATAGAPRPGFKRVQVGPNEVDYITDDVTIRQFRLVRARPRVHLTYNEAHIGTDVTIRNFASKPTLALRKGPEFVDR